MKTSKNIKKYKNKGFTLIELLVVISILGIMLTIIGFSASTNIKRKKALSVAGTLQSAAQTARDFAITGEVVNNELPTNFFLRLDGSSNPKKITIMATTSTGENEAESYTLDQYDPGEIKIKNTADLENIKFTVPHATLSSPTPVEIKVCGDNTCTNTSMVYTITVTENTIEVK